MAYKILIADDSKTIQQAAKMALAGKKDISLLFANDGRLALETAILQKPDLVLADHALPHKNGYEISQALAENPNTGHIPVAVLTSKSSPYQVEKAKLVGSAGYITKPFDSEHLLNGIFGALKRLNIKEKEGSSTLSPTTETAQKADPGAMVTKEAIEKIAREVIEEVVWEVVPQLAETLIKEEIERLTKSS